MEKNIPNNKTNSSMDMENAFYSQNKLMDELIKQMYNYDLYGNIVGLTKIRYNDKEKNDIINKLVDIHNSSLYPKLKEVYNFNF